MRILEYDEKKGSLKLKVETMDDLWLLHVIVGKDDVVIARTTREVKVGDDGSRSRRIPMVLKIRVLSTEFQPFTNRLRIRGIIVEGPEKYGLKGSHHTISVTRGSEITVVRSKGWPRIVIDRIKMSGKLKKPAIIVAVDRDEVAIGALYDYGVKIVRDHCLNITGKEGRIRGEEEREIRGLAKEIVEVVEEYDPLVIVVAGPGFLKEKVATVLENAIRERGINVSIRVDSVSSGGVHGVREAVRRDTVRKIVEEYSVVREGELMEEVLYLMAKTPNRITYGLDYVNIVASMGAVEKLLVLDEMISHYNDSIRSRIDEIIRVVESSRGEVTIFSSHSEPGKMLKGFGGVVAILRYELDLENITDQKR